jgi:hypothetical protein
MWKHRALFFIPHTHTLSEQTLGLRAHLDDDITAWEHGVHPFYCAVMHGHGDVIKLMLSLGCQDLEQAGPKLGYLQAGLANKLGPA